MQRSKTRVAGISEAKLINPLSYEVLEVALKQYDAPRTWIEKLKGDDVGVGKIRKIVSNKTPLTAMSNENQYEVIKIMLEHPQSEAPDFYHHIKDIVTVQRYLAFEKLHERELLNMSTFVGVGTAVSPKHYVEHLFSLLQIFTELKNFEDKEIKKLVAEKQELVGQITKVSQQALVTVTDKLTEVCKREDVFKASLQKQLEDLFFKNATQLVFLSRVLMILAQEKSLTRAHLKVLQEESGNDLMQVFNALHGKFPLVDTELLNKVEPKVEYVAAPQTQSAVKPEAEPTAESKAEPKAKPQDKITPAIFRNFIINAEAILLEVAKADVAKQDPSALAPAAAKQDAVVAEPAKPSVPDTTPVASVSAPVVAVEATAAVVTALADVPPVTTRLEPQNPADHQPKSSGNPAALAEEARSKGHAKNKASSKAVKDVKPGYAIPKPLSAAKNTNVSVITSLGASKKVLAAAAASASEPQQQAAAKLAAPVSSSFVAVVSQDAAAHVASASNDAAGEEEHIETVARATLGFGLPF